MNNEQVLLIYTCIMCVKVLQQFKFFTIQYLKKKLKIQNSTIFVYLLPVKIKYMLLYIK